VLIAVGNMLLSLAVLCVRTFFAGAIPPIAVTVDRSTRTSSMSILTTSLWQGGGVRKNSAPSCSTFVRSGVAPCGGERASFRSSSRPRNGPFDAQEAECPEPSEGSGCRQRADRTSQGVRLLEPIFVETRFGLDCAL
jgi:hypothetical protein